VKIMQPMRGRGWIIDAVLWISPLAGAGVFVARVLTVKVPRGSENDDSIRFLDLPGMAWFILLACAVLVPLIVAFLSRRVLGFLAVASLIFGVGVGTLWIRSHLSYDTPLLVRITGPTANLKVDFWGVISKDGGIVLERFQSQSNRWIAMARWSLLPPGRDQALWLRVSSAVSGYATDELAFSTTPAPLRHLGFGAAIRPDRYVTLETFEVPFALGVPYWFLCLLAAPLPLIWTLRQRRRRRLARRLAAGACANCGYDLRATPDAAGARLATCPECGVAAANAD